MPRKAQIQVRRDTQANWASANPILANGETGYETDTESLKFGNGTTNWNSLPYFNGGSNGAVQLKDRTAGITIGPAGSVADYVCTGSGDDATIQSAITAATANYNLTGVIKDIFVQAGIYDIQNTILHPSINGYRFVGSGPGTIFKLHNHTNKTIMMSDCNTNGVCNDVEIGNFTLDGNASNQDTGVSKLTLAAGTVAGSTGSGYTVNDILTVSAGNRDSTFKATTVNNGFVSAWALNAAGSGYTTIDDTPTTTQSGSGDGLSVVITAVSGGGVTKVNIQNRGENYAIGDTMTINGGSGDCLLTVTNINSDHSIYSVSITTAGTSYVVGALTIAAGNNDAQFRINLVDGSGAILQLTMINGGSGYSTGTGIATTRSVGSGATINITSVSNGVITGFSIVNAGTGYALGGGNINTSGGTGTGAEVIISSLTSSTLDTINADTPANGGNNRGGLTSNGYQLQYAENSPFGTVGSPGTPLRDWHIHHIWCKNIFNAGIFWNTSNQQEDAYGMALDHIWVNTCDVGLFLHEPLEMFIDEINVYAPVSYGVYIQGIPGEILYNHVRVDGRPNNSAANPPYGIYGGIAQSDLNDCLVMYCLENYHLTTTEEIIVHMNGCISNNAVRCGYNLSAAKPGHHIELSNCSTNRDGHSSVANTPSIYDDTIRPGFYLRGQGMYTFNSPKTTGAAGTNESTMGYAFRISPFGTGNTMSIDIHDGIFFHPKNSIFFIDPNGTGGTLLYKLSFVNNRYLNNDGTVTLLPDITEPTGVFSKNNPLAITNSPANVIGTPSKIITGNPSTIGQIIKGAVASTPATIGSLSGLYCWYKADALGLSDGALVGSWTDSSGNGHNATQSNNSLKPTFHTNIINGLPAIHFDGTVPVSGTPLNIGDISAFTAGEAFIVVKKDYENGVGNGNVYDSNGNLITNQDGLWNMSGVNLSSPYGQFGTGYFSNNVRPIFDTFGSTTQHIFQGTLLPLAQWRLYNVSSSANITTDPSYTDGWISYLDGNLMQQDTGGRYPNTVSFPTNAVLGNSFNQKRLTGYIAEFILFNRVLTASEKLAVNTYIAQKYNLAIAGVVLNNQTADLQQWQDGTGSVLAKIDASGNITAPNIGSAASKAFAIAMAAALG